MLSAEQKSEFHRAFERRRPYADGEADAYLESDSVTAFSPLEDNDLSFRLALTSNETLDLATNPICAGRLAAALLDLIAKRGTLSST
ncbi:hypothetical protein [Rhizobium anhuiense]|jgi:hypothetical protein|uniref:hypothetical protein n=1 Tax=Rhizobium anhuiense TaxID=1184720 RepID=UPI001FE09EAE|nr:hypothetical protein [Rhizobium anhuiense]UTS88428.1 hypothetical protein NE851_02405 [Rhizobium anhuiense bv. trifolii]